MRASWILLLTLTASAQEMDLSLQRAVELALAPNGAARAEIAREAVLQAGSRQRQALGALLPNIDGQFTYNDQTVNLAAFGIQFPTLPGFTPKLFVGPFGVADLRASATQSVFDLAAIYRWRGAKSVTRQANAEKENAENQVIDQVARAYLAALRAHEQVKAQQANVALAQAVQSLAERQKNAGTATGIDVVRAQVQLANEKQRLLVAQNEQTRTLTLLKRAIGLNQNLTPRLTDLLRLIPADSPDTSAALKAALDARPDLTAQKLREDAAALSYRSVAYERIPAITLQGNYGVIGRPDSTLLPTRTIGVALRVPLWDGGRRDARREEAAAVLRQEKARTRDLERQLEYEVRTALDSLRSAEAQITVAEEGLTLSQRELEQAQRRFENGFATSLEVTDAQTRLARARDNRIAALFNHNLARIDLDSALGRIRGVIQ